MLCHYGAFNYALLLPLTLHENAIRFSNILADLCAPIEVTDEYSKSQIEFCAGVANIPENCNSLDDMLAIAEKVHAG